MSYPISTSDIQNKFKKEINYEIKNRKNLLSLIGSSLFIKIKGKGKRKVRYQKNGRAYVIVNKKKLKL